MSNPKDDDEHSQHEIQVHLPPDVQRGVYANQLFLSHTQEEFILDFMLTHTPMAVVNARVIISPSHAKRMVTALQESLKNYEQKFGDIAQVSAPIPKGAVRH